VYVSKCTCVGEARKGEKNGKTQRINSAEYLLLGWLSLENAQPSGRD
jgi:hypothetical protein